MKKKLVVTDRCRDERRKWYFDFRDSDGLWEKYRVEDVATPEGFAADPDWYSTFITNDVGNY